MRSLLFALVGSVLAITACYAGDPWDDGGWIAFSGEPQGDCWFFQDATGANVSGPPYKYRAYKLGVADTSHVDNKVDGVYAAECEGVRFLVPRSGNWTIYRIDGSNHESTGSNIAFLVGPTPPLDWIDTESIGDGEVGADDIAANAVGAAHVADGALPGSKITDGTFLPSALAGETFDSTRVYDWSGGFPKLPGVIYEYPASTTAKDFRFPGAVQGMIFYPTFETAARLVSAGYLSPGWIRISTTSGFSADSVKVVGFFLEDITP